MRATIIVAAIASDTRDKHPIAKHVNQELWKKKRKLFEFMNVMRFYFEVITFLVTVSSPSSIFLSSNIDAIITVTDFNSIYCLLQMLWLLCHLSPMIFP